MKLRYARAKANPGYARLHRNAKVIGTWDDHDYGLNDAGKEFDRKVTNQRLMLDFLDEPLDSPRSAAAFFPPIYQLSLFMMSSIPGSYDIPGESKLEFMHLILLVHLTGKSRSKLHYGCCLL